MALCGFGLSAALADCASTACAVGRAAPGSWEGEWTRTSASSAGRGTTRARSSASHASPSCPGTTPGKPIWPRRAVELAAGAGEPSRSASTPVDRGIAARIRACRPPATPRRRPPVDRSAEPAPVMPGPGRCRRSRVEPEPSPCGSRGTPCRRGRPRRRRGQHCRACLQPLADRRRLPGLGARAAGLADHSTTEVRLLPNGNELTRLTLQIPVGTLAPAGRSRLLIRVQSVAHPEVIVDDQLDADRPGCA